MGQARAMSAPPSLYRSKVYLDWQVRAKRIIG